MITVAEVVELIRKEARGKLSAHEQIDGSTRLEDLGLSSLQVSEIVFTLEERYDVEFDDARAAEIRTLDDVVAVANEAIADQATAVRDGGDSGAAEIAAEAG
jgi:acyl carrier protein